VPEISQFGEELVFMFTMQTTFQGTFWGFIGSISLLVMLIIPKSIFVCKV
jgi:hypothetical protein